MSSSKPKGLFAQLADLDAAIVARRQESGQAFRSAHDERSRLIGAQQAVQARAGEPNADVTALIEEYRAASAAVAASDTIIEAARRGGEARVREAEGACLAFIQAHGAELIDLLVPELAEAEADLADAESRAAQARSERDGLAARVEEFDRLAHRPDPSFRGRQADTPVIYRYGVTLPGEEAPVFKGRSAPVEEAPTNAVAEQLAS